MGKKTSRPTRAVRSDRSLREETRPCPGSHNVPVNVANPLHIRYFAKSKGILHKTDKIDAKIIAEFALERKPEPTQVPSENELALKEFVALRRQLVKQRTELKNQLEHVTQKESVTITKSLIEYLTKRITKVEETMEQLIKDNSDWKKRKEILESVPGIGADTSRTLLAELPELGEGKSEKICSLVGVVPVNRDSGTMRGKRTIFGGRGTVRSALYMAAGGYIEFGYFLTNDHRSYTVVY
jgi:transposase